MYLRRITATLGFSSDVSEIGDSFLSELRRYSKCICTLTLEMHHEGPVHASAETGPY
jgi:hypothetical protein